MATLGATIREPHARCTLTACLDPLHPGPCKGWKGHPEEAFKKVVRDAKTGVGAYHTPRAAKGAPRAHQAALRSYVDGSGPINRSLRYSKGAGSNHPEIVSHIKAMDRVMAGSKLTKPIVTMRAISPSAFGGRDVNVDLKGAEYVDHAFGSTGTDLKPILSYFSETTSGKRPIIANMVLPKGMGAVRMPVGKFGDQKEILLDRGAHYRVVQDHGFIDTPKGRFRHVTIEVVPGKKGTARQVDLGDNNQTPRPKPTRRKAQTAAAGPDMAGAVYDQLAEDYPPHAIEWVKRQRWTGPTRVPTNQIDYSNRHDWQASREQPKIAIFKKKIAAGKMKPMILIKKPNNPQFVVVDGHHRAIAYDELNTPANAYITQVPSTAGPWDIMHQQQDHSLSPHSTKAGPHGPGDARKAKAERIAPRSVPPAVTAAGRRFTLRMAVSDGCEFCLETHKPGLCKGQRRGESEAGADSPMLADPVSRARTAVQGLATAITQAHQVATDPKATPAMQAQARRAIADYTKAMGPHQKTLRDAATQAQRDVREQDVLDKRSAQQKQTLEKRAQAILERRAEQAKVAKMTKSQRAAYLKQKSAKATAQRVAQENKTLKEAGRG